MMIKHLHLINLKPSYVGPCPLEKGSFQIATCQRTLLIGLNSGPFPPPNGDHFEIYEGAAAYKFLLETLCGLKSKMLAENEIVAQFKDAFHKYIDSPQKNTYIIHILEKAFKDAKNIRTHHLKKIGQLSYAGISKKILNIFSPKEILLIGSGQLAQDVIKLFNKKSTISISARNPSSVSTLCQNHGLKSVEWKNDELISESPFIINTIGASTVLFDSPFFDTWSKKHSNKLFIDLGSPSVLRTSRTQEQGVIRLNDILYYADIWGADKKLQVSEAIEAIKQVTLSRIRNDSFNFPYGWEELHFA